MKVNYCLVTPIERSLRFIKGILRSDKNVTFFVFTGEEKSKIENIFTSTIDIRIIPLGDAGSLKNWQLICSYVDYYLEKNKSLLDVGGHGISSKVFSRYLALSSLRIELTRLMALNNYVISHKVENMTAYSLCVSGSIVKLLPRSDCKMVITDGGVFNRLYCLIVVLNISRNIFQVIRGYLRRLISLQKTKNLIVHIKHGCLKPHLFFSGLKKPINNLTKTKKNKYDLNIYFFDLRPNYLVSKLSYILPIIKVFLEQGKTVRFIIDGGGGSTEEVYKLKNLCNNFLGKDNALCFINVKKNQLTRPVSIVESLKLLSKHILRKSFIEVLLFKKALSLNDFYMELVSSYPAKNWLGLIDSYQMTMITEAVRSLNNNSLVASIQFGTPDYTQLPYRYYQSDLLFTYDESSSEIYQSLNINSQCVVTGSLEKDALLGDFFRKKNDRVVVLFLDQPILQREDYSEEIVRMTYQFLSRIAKLEGVDVLVKCHPRRPREVMEKELDSSSIRFVDGEHLGETLMQSTFAISFVSALLDVAAYAGSIPVSIGGSCFYSKAQKDSFEKVGGIITEDVGELEKLIKLSSTNPGFRYKLTSKVIKTQQSYYLQSRPSEVIYDYLIKKQ